MNSLLNLAMQCTLTSYLWLNVNVVVSLYPSAFKRDVFKDHVDGESWRASRTTNPLLPLFLCSSTSLFCGSRPRILLVRYGHTANLVLGRQNMFCGLILMFRNLCWLQRPDWFLMCTYLLVNTRDGRRFRN